MPLCSDEIYWGEIRATNLPPRLSTTNTSSNGPFSIAMLVIHENFLPTRGRPTMVQLQPKGGTSMTSKMGAMGFKDLTYGTYVFHAGFLRYLEI